jgi:hypothetical protein
VLRSFSLRRKREAIIGVESVRATNADTRDAHGGRHCELAKQAADDASRSSSRGMNTATSEMLIERIVKAIFGGALERRFIGLHAVLDVAHDVLAA